MRDLFAQPFRTSPVTDDELMDCYQYGVVTAGSDSDGNPEGRDYRLGGEAMTARPSPRLSMCTLTVEV